MQAFLNEPRPGELSDDDWAENVKSLEWLAGKGLLGMKRKNQQ